MTFTNPTDYPDFTQPNVSGSGIIYSAAALIPGVYGPWYIGNLSGVALNCNPQNNGQVTLWQYDTPVFGAGNPWGQSSYNTVDVVNIYDVVGIAAPYLFLQTTATLATVQIGQATGLKGVPGVFVSSVLFEQSVISVPISSFTALQTNVVVPGPCQLSLTCNTNTQIYVEVYDFSGGVNNYILAAAMCPAPVTSKSGITLPFIAGNNALDIRIYNTSAAVVANCNMSVVSGRGF